MQEHVILLDEHGSPIGMEEKYTAHHHNTPLHLAFSSWLFNSRGECLVTRRAMSKKPGRASGPTPFAGIRKRGKRLSRQWFVAAAMK
jgi:isopentenyl-diphosphate delta-isomerase